MVAFNKRRFAPHLVVLFLAFISTASVNAGWLDSIAGGARWLGRHAVNAATYWAFNTTITDKICPKLSFLAPGTYARMYQNKLSTVQTSLLQNNSLGIVSFPVYLLSWLYGGAPLTLIQGIPMALATHALYTRFGLHEKPQEVTPPVADPAANTNIQMPERGLHRTLSDSCLSPDQTPAGRLHVPATPQPAVAQANAIIAGPDDDEELSQALWWTGRKILKFTGAMATGVAAHALGSHLCPWLGSTEWQYAIDYVAMALYSAVYPRIKRFLRPGRPVPHLAPEVAERLALMQARYRAMQVAH